MTYRPSTVFEDWWLNRGRWAGLHPTLDEILLERRRQDARWGEQNHPSGCGGHLRLIRQTNLPTYAELAARARAVCDEAARRGAVTWTDILVEEVLEFAACDDLDDARTELVQVAAVAVAAIDALDRAAGGGL